VGPSGGFYAIAAHGPAGAIPPVGLMKNARCRGPGAGRPMRHAPRCGAVPIVRTLVSNAARAFDKDAPVKL